MISQFADGDIPTEFGIALVRGIAQIASKLVNRAKLRIVRVERGGLHPKGMKVAGNFAMGLRAARLRDDLNDTAAGVAVLWFEAAGLDLYFLDEGLIDAAAEGTIRTCPNPQAAESRVIDRNAVSYVRILETARTRNRGVVAAGLDAVDRAGAQVEEVSNTALNRNIFEKSVSEIGIDGGS